MSYLPKVTIPPTRERFLEKSSVEPFMMLKRPQRKVLCTRGNNDLSVLTQTHSRTHPPPHPRTKESLCHRRNSDTYHKSLCHKGNSAPHPVSAIPDPSVFSSLSQESLSHRRNSDPYPKSLSHRRNSVPPILSQPSRISGIQFSIPSLLTKKDQFLSTFQDPQKFYRR